MGWAVQRAMTPCEGTGQDLHTLVTPGVHHPASPPASPATLAHVERALGRRLGFSLAPPRLALCRPLPTPVDGSSGVTPRVGPTSLSACEFTLAVTVLHREGPGGRWRKCGARGQWPNRPGVPPAYLLLCTLHPFTSGVHVFLHTLNPVTEGPACSSTP